MAGITSGIVRQFARKPDEPLNIICAPTHEAQEVTMAMTGHNFYAWRVLDNSIKDWNPQYRPLPKNYTLLDPHLGNNQLPSWIDFDLVLSQNKFGQYPVLKKVADFLRIPLISLEHTLPVPEWNEAILQQLFNMKGDVNVFISEYSKKAWGWENTNAEVVDHGIDVDLFKPEPTAIKKPHALSVVNKWPERNWCCGWDLWQNLKQYFPTHVVGDSPGLSSPAKDTDELVKFYNEAQIFLNTSLVSPIPTSLLEAMSCGTPVVSTATCMIPEIIVNGYNGYISNNLDELKFYCQQLLADPDLCRTMGQNARKTILDRFTSEKFVARWNEIFYKTANMNLLPY
jgi:glycosyltransferase involved in cell wall biosynthesis